MQLPAFRVFSFDPDFVQILFDDLATEMDMMALVDTFVRPTVLTKLLTAYVFFATTVMFGGTTPTLTDGASNTFRGTIILNPLEVCPYCEP
jgi:hypothetical protein